MLKSSLIAIPIIACMSGSAWAVCSTTVFRVDASGDNSDGSTWAKAYTTLQAALSAVSDGEIWVAAGTYYPGTNRTDSFNLANCVSIYGGFVGDELTRNERDWVTNETTLSGDIGIGGDDTDNSYHVVYSDGSGTPIDNTAILDGFVISGGYPDEENPNDRGAGIYNLSSSPTLTNMTITGNSAVKWGGYGGGIYNLSSNPILTNVTINGNWAANSGGGIYNDNSNPILTNVAIIGNWAAGGGGIYNIADSNSTLTNVTISGNWADSGGGYIIAATAIQP